MDTLQCAVVFDGILEKLAGSIEINCGLLLLLMDRGVLSRQEVNIIQEINNDDKKNTKMLEIIGKKYVTVVYDKFTDALNKNSQGNIVIRILKPNYDLKVPSCCRAESAIAGDQTAASMDEGPNEDDFDVSLPVALTKPEFYVSNKDKAYPMNGRRRGKVVFINVHRVNGMKDRDGTDVDVMNLARLFEELHFEIKLCEDRPDRNSGLHNLTANGIRTILEDVATFDIHARDQCFILFILSHGNTLHDKGEVVYGTDGHPVAKSEIREFLTDAKCPNLIGKPRVIFYQACRGIRMLTAGKDERDNEQYTDFMECYPCQPGYACIRNKVLGSRFARCIVDVFSQHAHDKDVEELMKKVNDKLPDYVNNNKWDQRGSFDSRLTKPLYFFAGIRQ